MGKEIEYKCKQCSHTVKVLHDGTRRVNMKLMVCNECKEIFDVVTKYRIPKEAVDPQDLRESMNMLQWLTEKEDVDQMIKRADEKLKEGKFKKVKDGEITMRKVKNALLKKSRRPGYVICPFCRDTSIKLDDKENHIQEHIDATVNEDKKAREYNLEHSSGEFSCFKCSSILIDWDGSSCPKCPGEMKPDMFNLTIVD
jgi:ferredoxin-thioredoxin reductase catalytic subunit